jgi:iron complex outermembrane receptor protein
MKRIAFFSFMLFASNAWSQSTDQDTTELSPVEVRATRAGNLAPFAKTNLNNAAIEKQNLGQDLPFLLNQTPSTVVNSDAGNGVGYTGIRIRGTDAARINVTLNGIPYNDAESQGSFFVDLPDFASSLNSIQVQRGVGTSSNGAGAFGGTINLSTNELITNPYGEFNNSYGSFNTWKNTIKVGTGLMGGHFTTDIRLSNITSDGYIDRASSDLKSYYLSSAYISDKTTFRLNIFSGKEKTYQAWYGVSEADLKTNRTTNYAGMEKPGSPYDNETDNYKQDHYQFFYNQRFNPNLTFNTGLFYVKGKGYYEQYKGDESYADYGLPNQVKGTETITSSDFIRQLWLDNDYFGDVFSLLYQTGKTQLTFGGAVTKYIGNHYGDLIWAKEGMSEPKHRWYDLNAWKNDASTYAKWQQEVLPNFQVYTDLQFRTVRYRIDGFRDNPDLRINNRYNFFNPKAGISYHNNDVLAYASYSIGKKEPNRDDFEAGVNQLPKPERLHDLEIGLEKKNKLYSLGATFYYMQYKDQLVLTGKVNDVGAYTRTNIDNSYRTGIELQAAALLADWLQLSGNLTLSRNKVLDFTEFVDDYDNGGQKINTYSKTDIAFSPNTIGAATVKLIPIKSLEIDFLSKYVGKQYLDNTSNEARKLDKYFTEDVRVSYTFGHKFFKDISIIAQANNVFNKKYEPNGYTFSYLYNNDLVTENYYYPMAGFNWTFGLNVKF